MTQEGLNYKYDAFISYSTDPDYKIVRRTKNYLEKFDQQLKFLNTVSFTKLKLCVDGVDFARPKSDSNFSRTLDNDYVDTVVNDHLKQSRCLLVFCSRNASKENSWVDKEVKKFLEYKNGDLNAVFLIVTEGEDPSLNPDKYFSPAIRNAGLHQHIWYDFRGFKRHQAKKWEKVRNFDEEIVRLAAHLNGKSAGDVLPPWKKEEQRKKRFRRNTLFVLILIIIALTTFVYNSIKDQESHLEAGRILNAIGDSDLVTNNEMEELWTLAASKRQVRLNFLKQGLQSEANAERLRHRVEMATRGAVGLDRVLRKIVINDLLLPCVRQESTEYEIKVACEAIGVALLAENKEFAFFSIINDIHGLLQTNNRLEWERFLEKLDRSSIKLTADEAERVFDYMLSQRWSSNLSPLPDMFQAFQSIAVKLDALSKSLVVKQILFLLNQEASFDRRNIYVSMLQAIASTTNKKSAENIITEIASQIKANRDRPYYLAGLVKGLVATSVETNEDIKKETLDALIYAISKGNDTANLMLSSDLQFLLARHDDRKVIEIFKQIEIIMDDDINTSTLRTLSAGLKAISNRVSFNDTKEVTYKLLLFIKNNSDPVSLEYLSQAIQGVLSKADSKLEQETVIQIINTMHGISQNGGSNHLHRIKAVASSFRKVRGELTPEQSKLIVDLVLAEMKRTSTSSDLRLLL